MAGFEAGRYREPHIIPYAGNREKQVFAMQTISQAAPPDVRPLEVQPPRLWTLAIWAILWSVLAYELYRPSDGIINWYTTVVWTLPLGVGLIGFAGAFISRPILKH